MKREHRRLKARNMAFCEACEDVEASVWCRECEQNFCDVCSEATHRGSKKALHERTPIPKRVICGNCEEDDAVVYCVDCQDNFCGVCNGAFHKGKKKDHKRQSLLTTARTSTSESTGDLDRHDALSTVTSSDGRVPQPAGSATLATRTTSGTERRLSSTSEAPSESARSVALTSMSLSSRKDANRTDEMESNVLGLSDDLLIFILTKLPAADVLQIVSLVCKRLCSLVQDQVKGWCLTLDLPAETLLYQLHNKQIAFKPSAKRILSKSMNLKALNTSDWEYALDSEKTDFEEVRNMPLAELSERYPGLTSLSVDCVLSGHVVRHFSELSQLQGLTISCERPKYANEVFGCKSSIRSLPPEIGTLTNLRHLCIIGSRLSGLPREIGKLTAMKELNLSKSPI